MQPRMIDLDPGEAVPLAAIVNDLLYPDFETHIAYRFGHRQCARLVRAAAVPNRLPLPEEPGWALEPDAGGSLDGIQVVPLPERSLDPGEIRASIEAFGLNFRDVFIAIGLVDDFMGGEFCGRVLEVGTGISSVAVGDRVVGMTFRAFASETVTLEELFTPAPPGFSVTELATIPTAFGEEILDATNGAGVDMVLNSLTGEGFIEDSLSCLAQGGRFVEMARVDIMSEEEMAAVRPEVAYAILKIDALKEDEPAQAGNILRRVMGRLAAGELTPIIHARWPLAEAGSAIKCMRAARHVGKIVLTASPLARGRLRDDRTYLVTGGLGGIGCAVAGWLAERGAGAIVLNGRRSPDPEVEAAIDALRKRGVTVQAELADVTDAAALDAMLARMDRELPALGGRDPQRRGSVGRRDRKPALGDVRDGDVAEDAGGLAPSPGDRRPRSGHVRPVLERGRGSGQSGPVEPRRGQRLSRSTRRPSARAGAPRTGHRLGRLVGDRRSRGATGEDDPAFRDDGNRMDYPAAGPPGLRPPRARGRVDQRCAGEGLVGLRRVPRRPTGIPGRPAGG